MLHRGIYFGAKIGGFVIIALAAASVVIMLLWNALVPELFHGPVITYWQALGLFILSHLLLRGGGPGRPRAAWRREEWKHRMEDHLRGWKHDGCGPEFRSPHSTDESAPHSEPQK